MTKSLHYLLTSSAVTFALILIVYAIRAPQPIIGRVPFAIMVCGLPLLISWPIAYWLNLSKWKTVVLYAVLFVLSLLFQGWLRTI